MVYIFVLCLFSYYLYDNFNKTLFHLQFIATTNVCVNKFLVISVTNIFDILLLLIISYYLSNVIMVY